MAKETLTDVFVRQTKFKPGLSSTGKPVTSNDYWDTTLKGFCLRITDDKKSWGIKYVCPIGHKDARYAFGEYPAMPLAKARERAAILHSEAKEGRDPKRYVENTRGMTLAELFDYYEKKHLLPEGKAPLRSAADVRRFLMKDVIQPHGTMPAKDFKIQHWDAIQEAIEKRGSLIVANRVFQNMQLMLRFAVQKRVIEINCLSELDMPHDENVSKRFLTMAEIIHFWNEADKVFAHNPRILLILRILLATGKRSNEVCEARRSEIDWAKRVWTIPASRVKGRDRGTKMRAVQEIVPLSDLAYALFQEAARTCNTDELFMDDKAPFTPSQVGKAVQIVLKERPGKPLGNLGMAHWSPHHLRKTVGTQMLNVENKLGITPKQKKLALNHNIKEDVSDLHYDMNKYEEDKRHALITWGDFLARKVGWNADKLAA